MRVTEHYAPTVMPVPGARVLVLTLGRARGSLAAVRALGQAGWIVGVGSPEAKGMVAASRWCHRDHLVPRPRGDAQPFVDAVREAVAEGGYDVVFGGGDDWMLALATYRDQIPAHVAHPPVAELKAALDKVNLSRHATAAGLAAPRTEPATEAVIDRWSGPVVVKCRTHWYPGQQHWHRIETRRYPDASSALRRVQRIQEAGLEPVLQEVIDGTLGALIGLMHEGRLVGRVQQETTALWPTPSGVSSRAFTVSVDEVLASQAETLLADLGWEGLVELQFLTDPQGTPHLIDLNGRFYGSMALANAAGANLADAWARQVLGHPLPRMQDASPGVSFVWSAGDLRRAFAERRRGLFADVASSLRWARCSTTSSVWDAGDIRPALNLLASACTTRVSTWLGRNGRSSPPRSEPPPDDR